MKGAADYEDQGDLKNRVNQVVAVLPRDADVRRSPLHLEANVARSRIYLKQHGTKFINSYGLFSIRGLG